jgi:phage/plasmid-like protein (TIGR03299 family)
MAHEVETMFSAREVPWHGLGTVTPDALTAADAIEAAGLDWGVKLHSLYAQVGGNMKKIVDRFAVVRDSDSSVLGTVGTKYTPFQNRDAFAFADSLVKDDEAQYETAGSLRHGRVIFLTMKMPFDITLHGGDKTNIYLMLRTSHDGTMAIGAYATAVRVVCMNTMTAAVSQAPHKWSVAHVSNMAQKLEEARDSMLKTAAYAEAYTDMGNTMIEKKVTDDQVVTMLKASLVKRPKTDERIELIMDYYHNSPLNGFQGTAWGAFNALTEYMDHGRETTSPEAVFNQIMDGEIASVRNKFAKVLLAV